MKQPLVLAVSVLGCAYLVTAPRGESLNSVPSTPGMAASGVAGKKAAFVEDAMVLERDGTGQFHLVGQVDGQDTEFLVDTGADMVALTVDEAERLGVGVDPAEFQPMTQTASGIGNGAMVKLDRLEIAGKEFFNVDAAVLEGLPVNLLGQSVLRELGQVSLQGDRMVIRR
jgi:aspartyl protease family protein